jgi:hypothetical protein
MRFILIKVGGAKMNNAMYHDCGTCLLFSYSSTLATDSEICLSKGSKGLKNSPAEALEFEYL